MKALITIVIIVILSGLIYLIYTGTGTKETTTFSQDVYPILQAHCLECHSENGIGHKSSGLSMVSYDSLMRGTRFGPVIKPGDSLSSTLVVLIEGRGDQSINMPHGDRQPLTEQQITTIRNWIDQGAVNN